MVGGGEDGDEVGEEKCDQNILYKILNFNRQKLHQVKKEENLLAPILNRDMVCGVLFSCNDFDCF